MENEKGLKRKKSDRYQILAENKKDEEPEGDKEEAPAAAETKDDSEGGDDDKSAASSNATENGTDGDNNSTTANGTEGYVRRYPDREDGDYGFNVPEKIEKNPVYKKEMK